MRGRAAALVILAAAACGPKAPPPADEHIPELRDTMRIATPPPLAPDRGAPLAVAPEFASGRQVRVALFTNVDRITLGGTGAWLLYDDNGAQLQFQAKANDAWTIQAEKGQLRAERDDDGERAARRPAPFIARAEHAGTFITVNGRPFRGEVIVRPGDHGLVVIDRLALEDYLRGVVPLEIGRRALQEMAAVEAQAIAARSYATAHVRADAPRGFDLLSTISDQVYGGVNAEQSIADAAIAATRSLVLTWQGRVIAAPYSSSCGGHTAGADETWHEGDPEYLRGVSDRVRGGDHFYCEIAPHFRWTREYQRRELDDVLAANLHAFATVRGQVGIVTDIQVDGHTPSGRVAALRIITDGGTYVVHGNDIRFALRSPEGEILPSTLFSMNVVQDGVGRVDVVRFTGTGNGHGVGMCQWGAIGRAREGASARAILRAYYPGAAVTALPE